MEQVVLVVLAWLAVGFLAAVGLGTIFRKTKQRRARDYTGRERRKTQRRTPPDHRATLLEEPDRRRGLGRRREDQVGHLTG